MTERERRLVDTTRGHDRGEFVVDSYEDDRPTTARLSTGEKITLPFTQYRSIITPIRGLRKKRDEAVEQSTRNLLCDEKLPQEARKAIRTALKVEREELLRTETLPYYQRLALWPTPDEQGDRLYTVAYKDGVNRSIDMAPDAINYTSELEDEESRSLDYPVRAIQPVSSSYLVVPDTGRGLSQVSYRDASPNFFGPGEDKANAFWISGSPRYVVANITPIMRIDENGLFQPRFVILPVEFYRVSEDRAMRDPVRT